MSHTKIKIIKERDKHKFIKPKYPEVKRLQTEKREYAVARGSSGFKRFKEQHPDYQSAEKEAKRLADQNGGTYLVISIVARVYGKPREGQTDTEPNVVS
jgi:hypothetical protein